MRAKATVRHALNWMVVFRSTTLNDFKEFVFSSIPGEDSLKEESSWRLGNSIFNVAVQWIKKRERDRQTLRFTAINQSWTSYVKNDESRVTFARTRLVLSFWLAMILAIKALDISRNGEPYLSQTGDLQLWTSCDWPDQTLQSDFEVREGRSPGCFLLVSGSEAICLFFCPARHSYVHDPMAEKGKLADLDHLVKLAVLA